MTGKEVSKRSGLSLALLYVLATAFLLGVWAFSSLINRTALTSSAPVGTNGETIMSELPIEDSTNGNEPITTLETSISSDDDGTAITINGQTESIAPGQPFHKSYESSWKNGHTQVEVTVDSQDTVSTSEHTQSQGVRIHTESRITVDNTE